MFKLVLKTIPIVMFLVLIKHTMIWLKFNNWFSYDVSISGDIVANLPQLVSLLYFNFVEGQICFHSI